MLIIEVLIGYNISLHVKPSNPLSTMLNIACLIDNLTMTSCKWKRGINKFTNCILCRAWCCPLPISLLAFLRLLMSDSCDNMPLNSFNPRLWFVIGLGTVLYLFMLLLLSMRKEPVTLKLQGGNTQFVSPKLDPTSSFYKPQLPMPDIEENVYELFSSMRHPDFIQPYQSANGKTFSHHNEIWTEPLGKDLLIVDIDTRYSAKIFAEDQSVDWETNEELVVDAVFNHYLFGNTSHNPSLV